MVKIAHIVNPAEITIANSASYLHIAQPVTLQSMLNARDVAQSLLAIELWAVKHKNESVEIPNGINIAKDLTKYAYDYLYTEHSMLTPKPLPTIADILFTINSSSDADFFIYSNIDISLQPDFYLKVSKIIRNGHDAFCINRQDIPKSYLGVEISPQTLPLAYISPGRPHPGVDCFVFHRSLLGKLKLNHVFVGFPPIGKVLKSQLMINASRFTWIQDGRYTFHLGNDRRWKKDKSGYTEVNRQQAKGLICKRGLFSINPWPL